VAQYRCIINLIFLLLWPKYLPGILCLSSPRNIRLLDSPYNLLDRVCFTAILAHSYCCARLANVFRRFRNALPVDGYFRISGHHVRGHYQHLGARFFPMDGTLQESGQAVRGPSLSAAVPWLCLTLTPRTRMVVDKLILWTLGKF
jgi:hypothetical protein